MHHIYSTEYVRAPWAISNTRSKLLQQVGRVREEGTPRQDNRSKLDAAEAGWLHPDHGNSLLDFPNSLCPCFSHDHDSWQWGKTLPLNVFLRKDSRDQAEQLRDCYRDKQHAPDAIWLFLLHSNAKWKTPTKAFSCEICIGCSTIPL